jgi:hypothetical protein
LTSAAAIGNGSEYCACSVVDGSGMGEMDGLLERLDADRGDVARSDAVLSNDGERRLDGGLRPPARSVRLEPLREHLPVGTERGPPWLGLHRLDSECRRPREAGFGKHAGAHSGHRAPAGSVLDHGRVVDAAHHLAPRAVVLGDAERLARSRTVETHQPGVQASRADRPHAPDVW